MPTIKWDKYTRTLVSTGFTEEQEQVLRDLIPTGFMDSLRSVGLDPRTFKLLIGGEEEKCCGDQRQISIFENMEN